MNAVEIAKVVQREFGTAEAAAILAAILVAAARWTEEDTKKYGTVGLERVQDLAKSLK